MDSSKIIIFDNILERIKSIASIPADDIKFIMMTYYKCKKMEDDLDSTATLEIQMEYLIRYFDLLDETFPRQLKEDLYKFATKKDIANVTKILCGDIFDNNKEYYAKIKEKSEIFGAQMVSNTKVPCKKCGVQNVFTWLEQHRCADEPADQFFKCLACGYQWKIRG